MKDILEFPLKGIKRKPVSFEDVERIVLLTGDRRDLYIDDPAVIVKIMAFLQREKIAVLEKT